MKIFIALVLIGILDVIHSGSAVIAVIVLLTTYWIRVFSEDAMWGQKDVPPSSDFDPESEHHMDINFFLLKHAGSTRSELLSALEQLRDKPVTVSNVLELRAIQMLL